MVLEGFGCLPAVLAITLRAGTPLIVRHPDTQNFVELKNVEIKNVKGGGHTYEFSFEPYQFPDSCGDTVLAERAVKQ